METSLLKVRLQQQLDSIGKLWKGVNTNSIDRVEKIIFFEKERYSAGVIENVFLSIRTRLYDICCENKSMSISLENNIDARMLKEESFLGQNAVEFVYNQGLKKGKIISHTRVANVGQIVKGCSLIGKQHPNYDLYILLPPSKIMEEGKHIGLGIGELVLVELTTRLCPFGTKWYAKELTTNLSGYIYLKDSRFMQEGSVLMSRFNGWDTKGRAKFQKPYSVNSLIRCDENYEAEIFVKYDSNRRTSVDGNLMSVLSGPRELVGSSVLVNLQGYPYLSNGMECKISGRSGSYYVAEPLR